MLNRRDLLSSAAIAALPLSASQEPPIVISASPPMIIQWLENPCRAEMHRAALVVEQWRESGMKTALTIPAEARLVQFIDGRWVSVLPPTCSYEPDFPEPISHDHAWNPSDPGYELMIETCKTIAVNEKIREREKEGWRVNFLQAMLGTDWDLSLINFHRRVKPKT